MTDQPATVTPVGVRTDSAPRSEATVLADLRYICEEIKELEELRARRDALIFEARRCRPPVRVHRIAEAAGTSKAVIQNKLGKLAQDPPE